MANLLGQDIGLNYKGIITIGSTINQNISASLQSLTDGDGNLLPIQVSTTQAEINGNLSFIKTDGTGYIQSAWQSASPTGVASNTTLWFDSTGRINWRLGTGFIRTFDATGITADRVYVLPNATTTLAGLSLAQTFTVTQSIIPTTTTSSGLIIQTGTTTSDKILSVYNAAGTAGWQSRAGDGRITFTGYNYGIESTSSNGVIYLAPGTSSGSVRINQSLGLIVGTDVSPSARLHIRGDGTNPIFRMENSSGTYTLQQFNNQQLVANVGAGGTFSIRSSEGTTNNPGFDFVVNNFGGVGYMEFAGLRYRIGTDANNGTTGMYFETRGALGAGSSRFSFRQATAPIAITSGTVSTVNIAESITMAAGATVWNGLNLNYTINNSGAQTGSATGIYLNATETALNSMVHNLMDLQVGGSSRFKVTNNGAINIASMADSAAPNSSLYYSTTASKLVWKDAGGVVNNLY